MTKIFVVALVLLALVQAHALDLNLSRRRHKQPVTTAAPRTTTGTAPATAPAGPISNTRTGAGATTPGASAPGTTNTAPGTNANTAPGPTTANPGAPPPPGGQGPAANDNNKQPANTKQPPDFKQAVAGKLKSLKILGSSVAAIATDPVRAVFQKLQGALDSVKAVSHISSQDFVSLKGKAAAKTPVGQDAISLALLSKLNKPGNGKTVPAGNGGAVILLEDGAKTDPPKPAPATPTAPAADPAAPKITCSWFESQLKTPDTQQRTPKTDLQQEGDYIWYATEKGQGAWSLAVNQRRCYYKLFSLSQYCRCSRTSKDVSSGRASMDVNVQVTCVEEANGQKRIVPPPATCRTVLRVQMSYVGRVWISTDGGTCLPSMPSLEGIASNEVMAKINDQDAFVKAGTVATGTKIESTISYNFGVKAGKKGDEISGEASVSIGYTEKITNNYGESAADIVGFATKDITAANNHALSAHLETISRVSITGQSYSWANGVAQTYGAGIWYAGTSDCPGITQPALGWLVVGTAEQDAALRRQAEQFTQVYRQMK